MRPRARSNYNGRGRQRRALQLMSKILPRLRAALDFLPSPEANRPGLLIRDPLRYTDTVLYLPPAWAAALRCLDGEHTELDVQELLTRASGQLVFSAEIR